MRRRFFVDEIRGGKAELRGDDAAHLTRVLRAAAGQRYEISDNRRAYLAEVREVDRNRIAFDVIEEIAFEESSVRVTLLASLIKFDRFEWMLEKATELGVAAIVPVEAERTEKGLFAAAAKRAERWRKIARESSQQARRVRMPEILPGRGLATAVQEYHEQRLFLEERPGGARISAASTADVALLAGPEGGWTDRERKLAAEAGWTAVSLGPNVLRAETAALAAMAIVMNV